jgi:hypothetical protein
MQETHLDDDDDARSATHLYDSDGSNHTNSTLQQMRQSHLHHIVGE